MELYYETAHSDDLSELFVAGEIQKNFIEIITNSVIKAEFELFIGYPPYQRTDTIKSNYRNGSHSKNFYTNSGQIKLTIPEDRNSKFTPTIIGKYQTRSDEFTSSILNLFKLGLSNKEIVDFANNVYGNSYSPQNISNITEVLTEIVDEFKARTIRDKYFALFIDATYIPIKFAGSYDKQAIYLVSGITTDGYQEIIGYTIGFTENATLWDELLADLKARGLKEVDIVVMDGARGVPDVVKRHYPDSDIQICTVHALRNAMNKVKACDKQIFIPKLRNLLLLSSTELIDLEAQQLIKQYPEYKRVINHFINIDYLFTYLKYPEVIHRTIKSTNRIEAINQKIKTRISHKRSFPNKEALEKILVSSILELNSNSTRKVNGIKSYIELIK